MLMVSCSKSLHIIQELDDRISELRSGTRTCLTVLRATERERTIFQGTKYSNGKCE